MSIASQLRGEKRPTHNASKRPRLFGFISKPAPFNVTAWQDQAHRANMLTLGTPKRSRSGFGSQHSRLSGFGQNPAVRRKVRKALRLAGWIRRARIAKETAAPAVGHTETGAEVPQKRGAFRKFLGRVFGGKATR